MHKYIQSKRIFEGEIFLNNIQKWSYKTKTNFQAGKLDTLEKCIEAVKPSEFIPNKLGKEDDLWWLVNKIPVCNNWVFKGICYKKDCQYIHDYSEWIRVEVVDKYELLKKTKNRIVKYRENRRKYDHYICPFTGNFVKIYPLQTIHYINKQTTKNMIKYNQVVKQLAN